jgi:hypothetical protein
MISSRFGSAVRAPRRGCVEPFRCGSALWVSSLVGNDSLLGVSGADGLADNRVLYRDSNEPGRIERFGPYLIMSPRGSAETAFGNAS